jgi:hypothetical protein
MTDDIKKQYLVSKEKYNVIFNKNTKLISNSKILEDKVKNNQLIIQDLQNSLDDQLKDKETVNDNFLNIQKENQTLSNELYKYKDLNNTNIETIKTLQEK